MPRPLQILLLLCLLAVASCTKIINVDLNSSNPQYVVEGEVTNAAGPYIVHITRSVNFSATSIYPAVSGALVVIGDGAGMNDTLTQDTPGYYHTHTLKGTPGATYSLKIWIEGNMLSASSVMPQPVPFDSLYVVDEARFGKARPTPHALYRDPADAANFYNFVLYKNNKRLDNLVFGTDLISNGTAVNQILRGFDSLNTGDQVRVDMQCIPKPVYDYYFSLRQTIQQNSATPANPVSNISGSNVLGYFSAHTTQLRSIVVQ